MHNPYQPPKASLELASEPSVPVASDAPLQYAGFWRRFGAYWIDALTWAPVSILTLWLSGQSRMFHLYWLLPGLALGLWFHIYLVIRYGGTPGKLLMKTRIAMTDGSAVTTNAALLRHSVLFVLSLLGSIAIVIGASRLTDAQYQSLGFTSRYVTLAAYSPSWNKVVTILIQVWVWGEFITMLFNKKRRAVHDFMAGTVVIRSTRQ